MPPAAERAWRHPSEMAAEARATAITPTVPSSTRSLRVPGPVWIAAAGFIVGVVMVGLIQTSRAGSTDASAKDQSVELPTQVAAVQIPSTTALSQPTTSSVSAGVATTYTSPTLVNRVSRPEGVLTVFAPDRKTVLGSAVATDDLILTSASSVSGHKLVYVSSALGSVSMVECSLLGTDGFSDLAVFTTAEPLGSINLTVAALSEASPQEKVTVISGGDTRFTSAASGKVLKLITEGKSVSGYTLAGIASTSVEATPHDAGAGLFNSQGALLGIVVNTGDHLASVLPIEQALGLAQSLKQIGWMTPNWAGIRGSSNPGGPLLVESVGADSPAQLAGLHAGDAITAIDGKKISSMADLVHYVRGLESGASIEVTVVRGVDEVELVIELGWN